MHTPDRQFMDSRLASEFAVSPASFTGLMEIVNGYVAHMLHVASEFVDLIVCRSHPHVETMRVQRYACTADLHVTCRTRRMPETAAFARLDVRCADSCQRLVAVKRVVVSSSCCLVRSVVDWIDCADDCCM